MLPKQQKNNLFYQNIIFHSMILDIILKHLICKIFNFIVIYQILHRLIWLKALIEMCQ